VNIYKVKLAGKRINSTITVKSDKFFYSIMGSVIVFVDEEGQNVALFSRHEVEYINKVE